MTRIAGAPGVDSLLASAKSRRWHSSTLVRTPPSSAPASAAREGRNPSDGETIQIAASTAAKFSAAAGLKSRSTADRLAVALAAWQPRVIRGYRLASPVVGRSDAVLD